jgi:aspartate/methionine/tyrosine aminotransferase
MFSRRTEWRLDRNRFARALEQHRLRGGRLLDLSISNPTQAGLSPDSELVIGALAHRESLNYDPQPFGLPEARSAVAGYYEGLAARILPDHLLLTTSTSEGYSFVFRLLCDPDDEVLIPTPSYPLFEFLATIQDVRLKPYELVYDHGWQIDFHSLTRAISSRTRAVILVNPNNPTGSFVKLSEREQLNRICNEQGLALIVDEVFFDFNLSGHAFNTFATNDAALTFTLSGLSKIAGLPQMKVAWIVAGGHQTHVRLALERLEVIADTYLSMNAPIQHAIPELLSLRAQFQKNLMKRARANLEELDRQLGGQKLCSRLDVEGGWYATLRVPATRTDEELAIELLESKDVLVQPGHFFDFRNDGYLVLSLMTPEAAFGEGVGRILELLNVGG